MNVLGATVLQVTRGVPRYSVFTTAGGAHEIGYVTHHTDGWGVTDRTHTQIDHGLRTRREAVAVLIEDFSRRPLSVRGMS